MTRAVRGTGRTGHGVCQASNIGRISEEYRKNHRNTRCRNGDSDQHRPCGEHNKFFFETLIVVCRDSCMYVLVVHLRERERRPLERDLLPRRPRKRTGPFAHFVVWRERWTRSEALVERRRVSGRGGKGGRFSFPSDVGKMGRRTRRRG